MKLSPRLCASIVVLAILALTAGGAQATHVNSELEQRSTKPPQPHGVQTKPRYNLHLKKPKRVRTIYHY
jgi:hypothetical protein